MGAFRTLRRRLKGAITKARIKPGTFNRRLTVVTKPTRDVPYEVSYHATKGFRRRQVSV